MTSSDMHPTLDSFRRLDEACSRFEREWRAGRRPSIDEFLGCVNENERGQLLRELLLQEWAGLRQRNESFDRDSYLARYAAQREAVESAWAQWQRWLYPSEADTPGQGGATDPSGMVPSLPVPSVAGYERIEPIGSGGMGVVYRAHDSRLKRFVALKMIPPALLSPDAVSRFRREARALARLSHPHIVQVYSWEEGPGQPLLVLEYVPGGTLEDVLRKGPLPAAEAARLAAILARAVQAAHEAGIVHRDLKPANVLLATPVAGDSGNAAGGYPKVSDFGLAALLGGPQQTASGSLLGTPAYMAPEQAERRREDVGPPADVWGLGVLLYQSLAGRLPFAADNSWMVLEKVRRDDPPPLTDVPPELWAICRDCLHKDPRRRPTAEELARRLETFLGFQPALPPVPGRRHRLFLLSVLVFLVVILGTAALWWLATQRPARAREEVDPALHKETQASGAQSGRLAGIAKEVPPTLTEPLRVESMTIHHLADVEGELESLGRIGKDSFAATFGEMVKVEVRLSRPAHAYLIEFNAAGKEELRWPVGKDHLPAPSLPPPCTGTLECPVKGSGTWLYLTDEPAGGLQAFAVVASGKPLPAYTQWRKKAGAWPWRKLPAGKTVWVSEGDGVYPVLPGTGIVRGTQKPLPGWKPLNDLVQALRRGPGVESVAMTAFPVQGPDDEP